MVRSRRGGDGSGGKVIPNLSSDPEGTRALNLSVLRRLDPDVTDILITAGHVAAYSFDAKTWEWSRKRVEGSLFIVKRSAQPRFQLVVMNRLNTENLVEDLLTDFEYDVQVPYLMYRNAADEIIGIWFYDRQECHEVQHLFSRIQYAFSRASPKANCACKSDFEELEAASAVHTAEDTLDQSALTIVPDDTKNEFLVSRAAACVGDTIGGTGAAGPDQSFHSLPNPPPHSASASQTSALHNLFPSQTPSIHMRPFDANIFHNSATIQPSSPFEINQTLLPPMTSTQTTMASTASSSPSVLPPLHPPIANHQPQSVPLHYHSLPLPIAFPSPPSGMPLLKPFPPPKPSPLLTPAASYVSALTRNKVKGALLRLVQNDDFIDLVYREIAKRPYP